MDQAIQDRVGQRWVADDLMPAVCRKLAGNEGGAQAVSILEDFQKVLALFIGKFGEAPVIKDEQISFSEADKEFSVASVCFGDVQLLEQSW